MSAFIKNFDKPAYLLDCMLKAKQQISITQDEKLRKKLQKLIDRFYLRLVGSELK